MLNINKHINTEVKYEIQNDTVLITVVNKKGKELVAKIDASDLEKVKSMGNWFGEWSKEYNNYIIQNISEGTVKGKKKPIKRNLQSVILEVSPKAPIVHVNGDTLDNRRCNLDIYKEDKKNEYTVIEDTYVEIIMKDKHGKMQSKALISKEDMDKIITDEYTWVEYKKRNQPHAVANTPNGRVFMESFIMESKENEVIKHINKNPLDNRRENLELVEIESETE